MALGIESSASVLSLEKVGVILNVFHTNGNSIAIGVRWDSLMIVRRYGT